ncbi:MAG: hypothetical protein IKD61_09300 [Oscillospiraceae bacterium]|nr:hypothetical protein [Oscillospiraceae bacterium]
MEGYVFTVPMALTDFVPVILFGISALLLIRDLKNKMSKGNFVCLVFGGCVGFLAGFFKALYKLLIALRIGAFPLLNDLFLPLQSSGLLLTGLAIVLMLALRKKAALMAPLTGGFIGMMVLGLGCMCAGLGVVSAKMKKKILIPVFILCFFCYMGMGYLAAKKDGSAAMNWIEQGVNTLGQILLLLGVGTLHKAGLREFSLKA